MSELPLRLVGLRLVPNTHETTVNNVRATPLKESELLQYGVNDHGNLPRFLEEVAMDEQVIARQENSKLRVRMLPTHDQVVGKLPLHLAVHTRPCFMGECQ